MAYHAHYTLKRDIYRVTQEFLKQSREFLGLSVPPEDGDDGEGSEERKE